MRVFISRKKNSPVGKKEFHGSCANVVHGLSSGDGGLPHRFSQFGVHRGARSFFEHLLMASLYAAFTLTKVDGAPCWSAKT